MSRDFTWILHSRRWCCVCGREEPDPGSRPHAADAASRTGYPVASHRRLRTLWYDNAICSIGCRHGRSDRRGAPASSQQRIPALCFLRTNDASDPAHLNVHLVMSNYGAHKTPSIKASFARHRRFQVHFTPASASWHASFNAPARGCDPALPRCVQRQSATVRLEPVSP
jgi:hypothetical protein